MANISHFTQTVNGVSTTYDIRDANAVDLTNNQTVGGNKEFTGTTTAHDLVPSATDTYNLGTSTSKWKLFNGINPGALSLPDSVGIVDILSTLQTTGYTASIDGYVRAIKYVDANIAHTFGLRNTNTGIEMRSIAERTFTHNIWIPVRAGEKVVISDDWENAIDVSKHYFASFLPCKGNV